MTTKKERDEYINKIKKMTNQELVGELLSKQIESNFWPDNYYAIDMMQLTEKEVLKRMKGK